MVSCYGAPANHLTTTLSTVQLNLNLTFASARVIVEPLERFVEKLEHCMQADIKFDPPDK